MHHDHHADRARAEAPAVLPYMKLALLGGRTGLLLRVLDDNVEHLAEVLA